MGADGRVRLCDFGFARVSEFSMERQAMTICGTPGFVAPEIMLGLDYDERCDVFSYGSVLAELITLQRPGRDFWNRTAEDNFVLNVDELISRVPSDCPKGFLELALKCVEYDPERRPNFGAILKELQSIESRMTSVVKSNLLLLHPTHNLSSKCGYTSKRRTAQSASRNNCDGRA
jgi:serine/threonine protein kinase